MCRTCGRLTALTASDPDRRAAEAALDGPYVVRTSVTEERLDSAAVVETYKRLSAVERDFRALKGDDLAVRPIFHWREDPDMDGRGRQRLCATTAPLGTNAPPPGTRAPWPGSPGRCRCAPDPRSAGPRYGRTAAIRSRMSCLTPSSGTRSWVIVSRSRTVTAPSSSESTSTVTHHGVPISSCRR